MMSRELLTFAIITLILKLHGADALGIDDFKRQINLPNDLLSLQTSQAPLNQSDDWIDLLPINIYNNRPVFYLNPQLKCNPSECAAVCSELEFTGGECSEDGIMPNSTNSCSCRANGPTKLVSAVFRDFGGNRRLYHLNDWVLSPAAELRCSGAFDSRKNECQEKCSRHPSPRLGEFGVCVKFLSTCACKTYPRVVETGKEVKTAPFAPPLRNQDVVVRNSSVYLVSDLCKTDDCQESCKIVNLANGICDIFLGRPACVCDTGLAESEMSELNITTAAGGLYTVNGWHLIGHDKNGECTTAICRNVCNHWGHFDNGREKEIGVSCFQNRAIPTSCGCMLYKSTVPSKEALALAKASSATTLLPTLNIMKFCNILISLGFSYFVVKSN